MSFIGFFGSFIKSKIYKDNPNKKFIKYDKDNSYIEWLSDKKFYNDEVFYDDENFLIILEGFILNSKKLTKKYKCKSWIETIIYIYNFIDKNFFNHFKGSFCGVFVDKKKKQKIIFTDHIGSKLIFIYSNKYGVIFSSNIKNIINILKKNQYNYSLNVDSAYSLLSFGYMIEDNTIIKEIKKINPGSYLSVQGKKIEKYQYYKLKNEEKKMKKSDIIDELDFKFRNVVFDVCSKDEEYGYKHLMGLSGGLDSRMLSWVANEMGFGDNIVNFTMSQNDYLDETIAKKIASDLKHEWIFKSLNNGEFLKNFSYLEQFLEGNRPSFYSAHLYSILEYINKEKFGILHTGQLGDVVISTFGTNILYQKENIEGKYYDSSLLIDRITDDYIKKDYENEEIFNYYHRGFNGCNIGLTVIQNYFETYSPFYDVDFLDFCLKIPHQIKRNHSLYFDWIMEKYPKMDKYIWEKTKKKVSDSKLFYKKNDFKRIKLLKNGNLIYKGKFYKLHEFFKKSFSIPIEYGIETKNHMNPFQYWYENNISLYKFINNYYDENISLIDNYPHLKEGCEKLFTSGNCISKGNVISFLSAYKYLFLI